MSDSPPPDKKYYELYQRSNLGLALTDTLDDLINHELISPQVAMKVLAHFDRCVAVVLAEKVRDRMYFTGHLDHYRLCDGVWTLVLTGVDFKMEIGVKTQTVLCERIKIVANNGSGPGGQGIA